MFINLLVFISLDFGHLKEGKNKYNNNRTNVEKNVVHLHMIMLFKYVARCRFREKHRKDSTIMPISFFPRTDFLYKCVACKYLLFLLYDENSEPQSFRLNNEFCN